MLESRLAEAQGRLETLFLEKFDLAHSMIEAMNERMQTAETTYSQASESYIRDMTEESGAIHSEYWEIRRAFQDEMARHQESERSLDTRISELEKQASHRISHEQQFCEQKWSQLAREAKEARRAGEEASKQRQERLAARV